MLKINEDALLTKCVASCDRHRHLCFCGLDPHSHLDAAHTHQQDLATHMSTPADDASQ